jgi:hypothetical protein
LKHAVTGADVIVHYRTDVILCNLL